MTHDPDIVPTRSVLRELDAERRIVREGREFLDQKRMLLAGEMLRRLAVYDEARAALRDAEERAMTALAETVARHGLDGALCLPPSPGADATLEIERGSFMGVVVTSARLVLPEGEPRPASNPSPEASRCREAFRDLLVRQADLAAQAATLERLRREYRKTERRTRALEDVLEPELTESVARVREALEEQDQEEAVRARRPR